MNRIDSTFYKLGKEGRKGLVGYLTAGDPDFGKSEENIRIAIDSGIDLLELGVPFSDPTADGPAIQQASHRALASGMNVDKILELVRNLRADTEIPIVLFGYLNPFLSYGYEKLCSEAAEAGVDGLLIVDLPLEESGEFLPAIEKKGMHLIRLIAPTTSAERAASLLKDAKGFVYYIMVKGVTGVRTDLAADVSEHVKALRKLTDLPLAVGFGVSNAEQAARACEFADAVVVGSALVRAAADGRLAELVSELRLGLEGK